MLRLAYDFLLPDRPAYLFVVLPLPCLTNSRYLTRDHFADIMKAVGFRLERERYRPGGKVIYSLWSRTNAQPVFGLDKKRLLNDGKKRNNFCILLS